MKDIFIKEKIHFNLKNSKRLTVPHVVTSAHGLELISFRGSQIWNTLPLLPNVTSFKTNIKHWDQNKHQALTFLKNFI